MGGDVTVVAIICECNPPHFGHRNLIQAVRERFGHETTVLGIMSGNYVQRGEPALFPKQLRAKAALSLGFDLILELPFPFSMASADVFAAAGVSIADRLGCVDHLVFGSECGDISLLDRIVENVSSPDFLSIRQKADPKVGYAAGFAEDYQRIFPDAPPFPKDANDILAISYLRELLRRESKIQPFCIKRSGRHGINTGGTYKSATELREHIVFGELDSVKDSFSDEIIEILSYSIENGLCPSDPARLDSAVISDLRLNPADADYADAGGGLFNRLALLANEACSISELCRLARTKNYTDARIRRALWFSFFGITSTELKSEPLYTQFLAADSSGTALLKIIGKCGEIEVLTKPTDIHVLSPDAQRQKLVSDKADRIYPLFLPKPRNVKEILSFTPYLSHN